MSARTPLPILVVANLIVARIPAQAGSISETFTGKIDDQAVNPSGPDAMKAQQNGTAKHSGSGIPFDDAQVKVSNSVALTRGQGRVKGTLTLSTPEVSAMSAHEGTVRTSSQGKITAEGRFVGRNVTDAFKTLKGKEILAKESWQGNLRHDAHGEDRFHNQPDRQRQWARRAPNLGPMSAARRASWPVSGAEPVGTPCSRVRDNLRMCRLALYQPV